MLDSLVTDASGNVFINSLRRSVSGVVLVPAENNTPIKVPIATAAGNGMSRPTPLEGPQDAYSEVFCLHGAHGMRRMGTGVITAVAGLVAVVGTNTLFLGEILPGDTLICLDDAGNLQTKTVAAANPTTNVNLNVTVLFAAAVTNQQFVVFTPIVADVVNRMRVEIRDVAWQRMLMNRPISVAHVFGNALQPELLKDAPLFEKNQMWIMQFYNPSLVAAGSFAPVATARKWQIEALQKPEVAKELAAQHQRKIYVQPYWLTNDVDLIIPDVGAQVNTGITFFSNTGDITLFLFNLYAHVIATGANPINVNETEPFTIELSETRTGRSFQNQPFTLNTGCGNAQFPFPLPSPIILGPRSQLKARVVTNYTNFPGVAVNTEIAITFGGLAVMTNKTAVTDPALMAEMRNLYRQASNPYYEDINCKGR